MPRVGYWRFNDGAGTTVTDTSGTGANLNLIAGADDGGSLPYPHWSSSAPPSGAGSIICGPHNSADLGAFHGYGHNGAQQPLGGHVFSGVQWSWDIWVYLTNLPPGPGNDHAYSLMQVRGSPGGGGTDIWLWIDYAGNLWTFTGGSFFSDGSRTVTPGAWHRCTLTSDGSYCRFYIDGHACGLATVSSYTGLFTFGYDAVDVGNSGFCDKQLQGYISEAAVWDEAIVPPPYNPSLGVPLQWGLVMA